MKRPTIPPEHRSESHGEPLPDGWTIEVDEHGAWAKSVDQPGFQVRVQEGILWFYGEIEQGCAAPLAVVDALRERSLR